MLSTHSKFLHITFFMKKSLPLLLATLLCNAAFAQTAPAAIQPASAASGARAPAAPPARGPELALALEAASTAVKVCSEKAQKIGVTVLDSAGVIKVVLATDGASARGVSSGNAKALTALQFKTASSVLQEQVKTDTALAEKIAADSKLNARAGAVLIKVGDEIIGAIGVGGARGSNVDEECAVAGLQVVQSRLK
jgi:uncharacterized protein GlcG (DUF336 family)